MKLSGRVFSAIVKSLRSGCLSIENEGESSFKERILPEMFKSTVRSLKELFRNVKSGDLPSILIILSGEKEPFK